MRRYETIVIIDPDLSEDDRNSLFTRVQEIVPQQSGILIEEDLWGARKLAYTIRKKPRGFYARYDYCGMGSLVDELERTLRIDDRVLKYMTVQLDEDADAEKILSEKAAADATQETAPVAKTPAPAEAAPSETAPAKSETGAPSDGNDEKAEEKAVEPADEISEKE